MPDTTLKLGASFQGLADVLWGSVDGLTVSVDENQYGSFTVEPFSSAGVVSYPVPYRLAGSTEYASYVFFGCTDLAVGPPLDPSFSLEWGDIGGPGLLYSLSSLLMPASPAKEDLYSWRLLTKAGHLWAGDGVRNLVAGAASSSNPSAIDGLEIEWVNLSTKALEVHVLYGLVLPPE